jgi:imidazolonepropionase-like amidohydrolase
MILLDFHGQYLAPGLINLHTHLFGNGVPKKAIANKGKSQARLLKVCGFAFRLMVSYGKLPKSVSQTALYSGVTTLRSVGDMRYVDVYVRDAINAGKYLGPRMLVSGPALTCPGGHGDGTIAVSCKSKEEYLAKIHENIAHHVDLIKITLTSGVMDALDAESSGRCSDEPRRSELGGGRSPQEWFDGGFAHRMQRRGSDVLKSRSGHD